MICCPLCTWKSPWWQQMALASGHAKDAVTFSFTAKARGEDQQRSIAVLAAAWAHIEQIN
jgi:hypothetical protein